MAPTRRHQKTGRPGDRETGRQGDRETGNREKRDRETGDTEKGEFNFELKIGCPKKYSPNKGILKLAKKAYVPNSDQSRKKGAGGKEDID